MHPHDRRRRPFWYLRRERHTVSNEVDEELDVHLQMRAADLKARGMAPDAARREAMRQFGDLEGTRQYCRRQGQAKEHRMRLGLMLDDLRQDVRICLRNLARAPVLTATIVATVGLGIGATTLMFGAVDAVLLRPLPYRDPDRLVRIYTDAPPNKFPFSVADYLALEAQQTQFEQIAGYTERAMAFTDGSAAERLRGRVVSWGYFALLGVTPVLGRSFTAADARPGSPPTVIVSHAFWQQRLGGRHDVVGRPIRLDGVDHALAGVLPPATGPLEAGRDFFVAAQWEPPRRKGPFFITALGRLRPGADPAAAASELRIINKRLFPIWRASYQDERATWGVMDLKAHVISRGGPDVAATGGLALAAVALLWLIASANASSLLVARVTSRRRELAVRAALGASRERVIRYLLAESALLAAGAAAIGIALAWSGVGILRTAAAPYVARTQEINLGGPVLWVLAALTAASALLFGLVPALHGTGGPIDESLRSLGRSVTGSPGARRLRSLLVGSQFAIATPLLVVAGLLIVSLNHLRQVDLGFETQNILTGGILLPQKQYQEGPQVVAFWDELRVRLERLPGVAGMAFSDGRPPDDVGNVNNFNLEASPTPPGQSEPVAPWLAVTPDYFRLLGLSLVDGRLLDERDTVEGSPPVVVVDRAWANRFFPDGRAVGQRMREGGCTSCPLTTVIGVVSDVKYAGLDAPNDGAVYSPLPGRRSAAVDQVSSRFRYFLLRTTTDPAAVLPAVRQIVREMDPTLPLSGAATIDDMVDTSLQMPRSLSLLVAGFAIVALLLSIVGIYGVMAYYVQQHAKDIGIRLALGGSIAEVLQLVVGQGMKVVASGVAVGLLTALVLTRLMSSLLFGVSAADAVTFAVVTLLMLGAALAACFVPARRATTLQPAAVLRSE